MDWKNKVIYQIYPRSFMDSSGSGTGDLNGIKSKVNYIKNLGVDYVWISPFFESPQKDFGYDVSNYRKVDKLFGNNDDFKKLVELFHKDDIGIIIDLVLSHTSDEHKWFKESSKKTKNEYTDWYIWADGEKNKPPNNWLSVFGGSSWKWDQKKEQFYLHNFLESQPDLNFHNIAVQNQMLNEIQFWLDFGIDGFRFDVINFLFHDKGLRNNPYKDASEVRPLGFNKDNPYGLQHHKYDNTQKDTLIYLEKIRRLLDKYNAISIGEIVSDNPLKTIADYTNNQRLHMAYCFEFLSDDFNFEKVDEIVNNFFDQNPHSWPCWAFSNHDATRVASRVNKSPKEIMGKLLSLRGNICIYQGEELGLRNSILEKKDIRDPFGLNFWPKFKGRDGCRTPLPWNSKQKNYGFSSGRTWLPCDKKFEKLSVDIQENDKNSMLNFTREKISQRKKLVSSPDSRI